MEYDVKFRCTNCQFIFTKTLPKQSPALGAAGSCPKCGCNQETVGKNGQKIGVFQIVPEDAEGVKGNKFEVLLENDGLVIKQVERSSR